MPLFCFFLKSANMKQNGSISRWLLIEGARIPYEWVWGREKYTLMVNNMMGGWNKLKVYKRFPFILQMVEKFEQAFRYK